MDRPRMAIRLGLRAAGARTHARKRRDTRRAVPARNGSPARAGAQVSPARRDRDRRTL